MPQYIDEGQLRFEFPDNWKVSKFDDWSFYRNQFINIQDGLKALDILAIDPDKTLWLIEVKDYRHHQRSKEISLADEIIAKVLYTLAALLPARIQANESAEKAFASAFLKAKKLRVVLHLEQVRDPSRLFPRAFDPADIYQKLRMKLKPIDAHPCVMDTNTPKDWKTTKVTHA